MQGPITTHHPFAKQLTILLANQDAHELSPEQLHAFKRSNAIFLTHYQNVLEDLNPATFIFLNDEKKVRLREQLQHTLSILTIQVLINNMDKRYYHQKALNDAIALCQSYQEQLKGYPPVDNAPSDAILPVMNAAESPIKYLGLLCARWLAKQFNYVPNGNTVTLKNWIRDSNKWRLYWVWGGGLLMTVLQAIPANFFNDTTAQLDIKIPANVLGYLSWAIYYFRLGLNLCLFIKHALPGKWSWMSEEEKKVPTLDRINAQWHQRKFTILNDLAWGTVGLLCFCWLIGSSSMVYAGNTLTSGLLVFDVLLACWHFFEEQTQFKYAKAHLKEKISDLDKSIQELTAALEVLKAKIRIGDKLDRDELVAQKKLATEQLAAIQRQRDELDQLLKTTKTNWTIKKASIVNDLIYSCGLLVGWSLIGGVFFPPSLAFAAQSTILALSFGGAVYCFVLTVTYQAIVCYLEVAKIRHSIKENIQKIKILQKEFNDLN